MSKRWALMERFEVPNLDDPSELYLTRWRIVATPWCSLFLHRMDGPDSRPTLHDHPWPFVSFVLRGGYDEERLNPTTLAREGFDIRRWNFKRATDFHYIARLHRVPTWTLLLVGRRRRTWGYAEQHFDADAFYVWTRFDRHRYNEEFERAMADREAAS